MWKWVAAAWTLQTSDGLNSLFPGGVAPVGSTSVTGSLVACFSLSLLVGAFGRVSWKVKEKSLLGIVREVPRKDAWKSPVVTNPWSYLSGMDVGFISFRNLSHAAFAVLWGRKWGFSVVKEVKREAFVGSQKASAKMLLSSCALRLCAAAAETTGSWKCCWSCNSLRAAIS